MPTLSAAGASASQIRVSMASSWQKKNFRSRSDWIMPVLQEAFGDAGSSGIGYSRAVTALPPGFHPGPYPVDQRQLYEDAGII